ncbi:FtsK/SpoIIIE domain-containing protein [Xanthobacter agilis]|uniref:FtsK/SpoIIIE domain-containing protein n=1 Tax=Xanthobacter agilis TaxID=47492 RepID=UPI00372773F6
MPQSSLDLIGGVAARRLKEFKDGGSSRAFCCIMGLEAPVVTAIARHTADADVGNQVEVFVHPSLADGAIGAAILSDKPAPWHRNHAKPGVRLTVCSVPPEMVKATEPTLAHTLKIDDAWLLQDPDAWVQVGFNQSSEDLRGLICVALSGLLQAGIAHDARTVADFIVATNANVVQAGFPPEKAVRAALTALRLPKDAGDHGVKITESPAIAAQFFRKAAEDTQAALYLKSKDGDPLNRNELRKRLDQLVSDGGISAPVAERLRALLSDRSVYDGSWTQTQEEVAQLGWDAIEPFFSSAKRKTKPTFGAETKDFFSRQFPTALTPEDQKLLDDLTKDSLKPNERLDAFFSENKSRLQTDPRLYKRWERLVFQAPIEAHDLTEGLLRLAHRAVPDSETEDEESGPRTLIIKLRGAERLDFWCQEKNLNVLRYLRDRYRGLDALLRPHAMLSFGRCWSHDWEADVTEANKSSSRTATELEFEAFLVKRDEAATILSSTGGKPHPNRAQLIWRPFSEALGLSLSQDLRQILPKDATFARLMTGRVQQSRVARAAQATGIDLAVRTSIIDAFGSSDGLLANPTRSEDRIDTFWPGALQDIERQRILTPDQAASCRSAYDSFLASYSSAVRDLLFGDGVGARSLISQAEAMGLLLETLQKDAPQEICIVRLLAPLARLGIVTVEGDAPSAIVAPWQPLRLAEMGAKAYQLANAIAKVIDSSPEQRADIQDFVDDRAAALTGTYYGDVAILPGDMPQLLHETQSVADCSLVESLGAAQHRMSDEPAAAAVKGFNRVATEYLNLRPHERANFTVVVLNADSENLPVAMANGLSKRIEDDPDLRCELVITDDDPARLRQVYEHQNRRISYEIDANLASEASRNFLSRLRLGILSPETLTGEPEVKSSDIVLLQDVIARNSKQRWIKADTHANPPDLTTFAPTQRSKRRPFRMGNTTSALFLTAPLQPSVGHAYINALHAIASREATPSGNSRLPVQEVEFRSGGVAEVLKKAHALGNWVITFDRVADRRLVANDARRIIRYFSVPGSTHNVIVSTEIEPAELADCISGDLDVILPSATQDLLEGIRGQLFKRAAELSGGVVMRGAQWKNYAHELLGVVLAQREIDRLLRAGRQNKTGWFFLDDFREWLDLSGEMADILAVDFSMNDGSPEVRLVLAEAKYAAQDNIKAHRDRSLRQLESTYTALKHRLLDRRATLDPAIWRHRIADMVLEHMEPFDQVGGISQDDWLEGLRTGLVPIKLEAHSLVFSYDLDAVHETMPIIPDEHAPRHDRRQMAQWVFGRHTTAKALRELGDDYAAPLLSRPAAWPALDAPEEDGGTSDRTLPEATLCPQPAPIPSAPSNCAAAASENMEAPESAAVDETPGTAPDAPSGPWSSEVASVLRQLSRAKDEASSEAWLQEQIVALRSALQTEGMDAPVLSSRLTPNTGLIYVGGRTLTVGWLEKKQTDLLTRYGLDIIRITPMPGQIAIGLRRPTRAILHLADAWLRRQSDAGGQAMAMSPLLGEKEDDGELCFLPLAGKFRDQEAAAPHSLISGTTGSGKGILVTNLILDLCALNSPRDMKLYLIDPKRGVDYAWARGLPHLKDGIVDDQEVAQALLAHLVDEVEARYQTIAAEQCRNIDHYNRKVAAHRRLPRVVIFFDEVANWMQDDDFKNVVDGQINKIVTMSRAAGFHLFMIYQRADNQVMTMQLRTNLGNKLILRLGDEGSSRIALGERGADRLLGKGHLIAKLGTDDKTYMQVPYIGDDEVEELADAVIATWSKAQAAE